MAVSLRGEHKCKCGHSFRWTVLAPSNGEAVVFWANKENINATLLEHSNNSNTVEVFCPVCHTHETIMQEG